jgi:TRAP-type mannitol/chloroaromatic compound transport system permease small subunit
MRNTSARIADEIDRITAAIGRIATWCSLYVVVAEFAVVLLRYVLGFGSIRLQESVLYAHAGLFMLAAAWTLQISGHVRVDVFYARGTPRARAIVDLVGAAVFLLPFAAVLFVFALPYVERSWHIFETSPQPSGLPFVYLFKTVILVFAVLIGLQGLAQIIRAALILSAPPRRQSR